MNISDDLFCFLSLFCGLQNNFFAGATSQWIKAVVGAFLQQHISYEALLAQSPDLCLLCCSPLGGELHRRFFETVVVGYILTTIIFELHFSLFYIKYNFVYPIVSFARPAYKIVGTSLETAPVSVHSKLKIHNSKLIIPFQYHFSRFQINLKFNFHFIFIRIAF